MNEGYLSFVIPVLSKSKLFDCCCDSPCCILSKQFYYLLTFNTFVTDSKVTVHLNGQIDQVVTISSCCNATFVEL